MGRKTSSGWTGPSQTTSPSATGARRRVGWGRGGSLKPRPLWLNKRRKTNLTLDGAKREPKAVGADPGRVFVATQAGRVKALKGAVLPSHNTPLPILTLSYFVCFLLLRTDRTHVQCLQKGPTWLRGQRSGVRGPPDTSGNIPPSWTVRWSRPLSLHWSG